MPKTHNLKTLYDSTLKPSLKGMERQRRIVLLFQFFTLLAILIALSLLSGVRSEVGAWFFAIFATICILVIGVITYAKRMAYRANFKEKVVSEIIRMVNPDYHYDANKHIAIETANASQLFKRDADKMTGDDYVSGYVKRVPFEFSEINLEKRNGTDDDGNPVYKDFFHGLFFTADFHKHFNGEVYVYPDKMEKMLGSAGTKLQRFSKKGELVKLENKEFERFFVVYGTDQVVARYILTPKMMEAMVNIQCAANGWEMMFSFINGKVYCAIESKKLFFEPKIIRSGVSYSDVEEIHNLFSLIEVIIEEMNLNTRIWTKPIDDASHHPAL